MKKRSILLPLLAVLFAIAGAFATGNMRNSSTQIIRVTDPDSQCEEIGSCDGSGGLCETNQEKDALDVNSENCSVQANGNFVPDF